ncbi:MAG: flagellar biosynthesis protein FlhA [Phycisphaerales bacterium]|nr:flagellar biosynthesis protein FlhA [Phycisphaerales bacterium]
MAKAPANRPRPKPTAPAVAAARPALSAAASSPAWAQWVHRSRGLIVPIGFVLLLAVIVVPVPPFVLDLLISLNISLSVIILLTTIYMDHPLEFSVFPSLLLATTLFRLVLNIASTRLVLTADAPTPEAAMHAAGHVIAAFGNFVAGSSLFVGIVIFLILVIVQFVVITKGATRISEVAARFTLDAMPGKQMAIDSDLSAGIIDEAEARKRREDIRREADFFGAMDGASKFVRGDAVAGIIITAINIIGGFAVGVIERGWLAAKTAETFTKLTIGDGLAAQIPSFVIAIASALIVTRSGSKDQLGNELTDQLVAQPRGLVITAAFLLLLSFTPLPTAPLVATATVLGGIAFMMNRGRRAAAAAQRAQEEAAAAGGAGSAVQPIESLLKLDTLELEVGYGLVSLVDAGQGGDLLDRISALRRQLALELGLVMPPVRIRDNMQLEAHDYRVKIRGNTVAGGQVRPGMLLAMDSGIAGGPVEGDRTKEPAFGLDAWWINPSLRARAEGLNYTVVDPTSVLGTHLTEIVRSQAAELLTRDEVNNLIEQLKLKAPKLVEETIPTIVKTADLQKVLQNLLRERVPIRDTETIIETLADWAPRTKDLDVLTEYVRNALRRTISLQHAVTTPQSGEGAVASRPRITCVTLDPALEDQVAAFIDRGAAGTVVNMPPRVATRITERILESMRVLTAGGHQPVIVASPQVRAVVRQLLEPHLPTAAVLAYNEIIPTVEVESVALVTPPTEKPAAVAA